MFRTLCREPFGFLAKWRLIEAGIEAQWTWAVVVIAASSLISLVYVGRMLETIFFRQLPAGVAKLKMKEMGSRYLFIVLYVWLENTLSRGDYRRGPVDAEQPSESSRA